MLQLYICMYEYMCTFRYMWIHNMHMYVVSQQPERSTKEACYPHLQLYIPTWIESSWLTLENLNRTTRIYSIHWKRTLSTYVIMRTPHHSQDKWFYCQLYIWGSLENPPLLPCPVGSQGTHVTSIHMQDLHIRALKAGLDLPEWSTGNDSWIFLHISLHLYDTRL